MIFLTSLIQSYFSCKKDVFDLIDLSQPKCQRFSFSKPLINYIFSNSRCHLLLKSCKTFKLLHLKNTHLDELQIYDRGWKINNFLYEQEESSVDFCRYKIDTEMKSIKIVNSFTLLSVNHGDFYVTTLMPKLDLSQAKKIKMYINKTEINMNILEKLLPPLLEKFDLNCYSRKVANTALLVFQRCTKIKSIQIMFNDYPGVPVITKEILKKMVATKRENKIEKLAFYSISEVDANDFINLIENHLAPNCDIFLATNKTETFNKYEQMFAKIKEIRQRKLKDKIQIGFSFRAKRHDQFL